MSLELHTGKPVISKAGYDRTATWGVIEYKGTGEQADTVVFRVHDGMTLKYGPGGHYEINAQVTTLSVYRVFGTFLFFAYTNPEGTGDPLLEITSDKFDVMRAPVQDLNFKGDSDNVHNNFDRIVTWRVDLSGKYEPIT